MHGIILRFFTKPMDYRHQRKVCAGAGQPSSLLASLRYLSSSQDKGISSSVYLHANPPLAAV